MAKHEIYFCHGGEQRTKPPPLELILYSMEDDPAAVEEAGRRYGKWLIQNASGNWTRGLRKAFEEYPVMGVEYNEEGSKNEGHQHDHSVGGGSQST